MATSDRANADLRRRLAVDTPPSPQIAREKSGLDTDMPLSPQWLIPKLGENKEPTSHGIRSDVAKAVGNGEDISNTGKKKDVFRASVLDGESGRRDRWRDDEREPNSGLWRTRWRETDKEHGDTRKVERWSDDSKHSVDGRRPPQERWGDSNNKEGNYDQRRESKWSTRWGPNDKELENRRDRWGDSGKEGDASREKGFSHYAGHGKDGNNYEMDPERDDNISRSWKSSYPVGRGRGDFQTQQKPSPNYACGRGRSDNESPNFSSSRGKFTSGASTISTGASRPFHLGLLSDRPGGASGERSAFKYSRMKLLDIYRTSDVTNFKVPLDDFEEVSALMQEGPLEPLALFAPTAEESVILKGIDKGDIINSGVHQASKDGSVGKSNVDMVPSKQPKLGGREDQLGSVEDYKGEMVGSLRGIPGNADLATRGESLRPETSNYVVPQRSRSIGEHMHGSTVGFGQQISNALDKESKVGGMVGIDELDSPMQPHPNPESLSLHYKDPQGHIQGPFSGADIIGWFEAAYFGIDLLVRVASAPPDAPFLLLGDVMPHLRAKARPPPGFCTAKPSDVPETSLTGKFVSSSTAHPGSVGAGIFDNVPISKNDNVIEAQNRFIESLMSNNMRNPSTESISTGGVNEYGSGNFGNITVGGGESENSMNYLLAQKRLFERQNSLQNPLPYWSGDVLAAQAHKKDIIPEASALHSKLLPPVADPSRQALQSQNVDLLSMLRSAEKPQQPAANSGLPLWSNYPEARNLNPSVHGVDIAQGSLNPHNNLQNSQQIGLGVQQHNFIPQNQPPLAHLNSQTVQPDKLLSEVSQDPQLLNVLQQQYLLSQLQLQAQTGVTPHPQLSLLDKMLLLKQQQHQQQQQLQQQLQHEQQQQQLLLQQQHLLSQVMPRGNSNQQLDGPSYGPTHASLPSGDSLTLLGLRRMQEVLEVDQKVPVHGMHEGQPPSHPSVSMRGMECVGFSQSSLPTPSLPHEITGHAPPKECYSHPSQQGEVLANAGVLPAKASIAGTALTEVTDIFKAETHNQQKVMFPESSIGTEKGETVSESMLGSGSTEVTKATVSLAGGILEPTLDNPKPENVLSHISNQVEEMKIASENNHDAVEPTVATDIKVPEIQETRKSEKKKKKKKQAAVDVGKGAKTVSSQQEVNGSDLAGTKHDLLYDNEELFWGSPVRVETSLKLAEPSQGFESSEILPPKAVPEDYDTLKAEWEPSAPSSESQAAAAVHRVWKSTPGPRPKSLLEIQAEEQLRAQRGLTVETVKAAIPATSVSSIPWNDIVGASDQQFGGVNKSLGDLENANSTRSKRSQLHDLLAEEVLAKSSNVDNENTSSANDVSFPRSPAVSQSHSPFDDNDFIEAKDSKKNKKKATKAKGSAVKAPSPVGSIDLSAMSMPMEKGKSSKHAQHEKEILPTPPSGPSLGDFVPWKNDQANSVLAPAWSNDSAKVQKPLSLRDIQREQERKSGVVQQQAPPPTPAKVPLNQRNHGNASWQASGSSPSKAGAPVQMSSSASSNSKSNAEDDLFWGPSEHSKQDKKQSEFPSLSSQTRGSMVKEPVNRQKSQVSRLPLSSASLANNTGKGKADAANKQTEAMDFRDWCESEWARLTGTNDTSFLEFCIKQSTSEAEMLLMENIGSLDRNHAFIDKFLKYKAFLSTEVIEMAFQAPSSRGTHGDGTGHANSATAVKGGTSADMEQDGGKKKGKKGKKVSAADLGFNVVSNRIMMGEIQNIED